MVSVYFCPAWRKPCKSNVWDIIEVGIILYFSSALSMATVLILHGADQLNNTRITESPLRNLSPSVNVFEVVHDHKTGKALTSCL